MQKKYLVVGGGNVGLATIAHISAKGYKVYLFSRRPLPLSQTHAIYSTGEVSPGIHGIAHCSTQIESLANVNGGTLPRNLILCCRGQDIADYARLLTPYITPEMNVLIICASRFAGQVFSKTLHREGIPVNSLPAVADVNTSPFVSRTNTAHQVDIQALKGRIDVAAQNSELTNRVVAAFQPVFGNLFPAASSLEVNLHKCDDTVHIPLLLTAWYRLESGANHNLYHHVGRRTAQLIVELDNDRLAVGKALGLTTLLDICSRYTTSYGTTGPTIYDHLQQVKAYAIATVGNPYHRYLMEDLPFGAYPLKALAEIAGVKTPFLDSCITLGSKLIDLPSPWTAEFLELGEREIATLLGQ